MPVLVDSNILIDLFTNDPKWADWSEAQISQISPRESLLINPLIYAEISIAFSTPRPLEKALHLLGIEQTDLPYEAAFSAGKVFLEYRKRGGAKRSPLPDFYIGAHAEVAKLTLLTRDPKRYQSYFPKTKLICPE